MPKKRKADVFAGKDSLAYRLKRRRMAVESGDLEGAPGAFRTVKKKKAKKRARR